MMNSATHLRLLPPPSPLPTPERAEELAYKVLPDILRRLLATLDLEDHAAANMIRAELRAATSELDPVIALLRQEAS